jgi:pimeloyl-CoA synthetase
MKEMPVQYTIRIPSIDELLKEHNHAHIDIVSVNNTEQERKTLKELDDSLVKEIGHVNDVVNEVLEYLQARGCKTSEYI